MLRLRWCRRKWPCRRWMPFRRRRLPGGRRRRSRTRRWQRPRRRHDHGSQGRRLLPVHWRGDQRHRHKRTFRHRHRHRRRQPSLRRPSQCQCLRPRSWLSRSPRPSPLCRKDRVTRLMRTSGSHALRWRRRVPARRRSPHRYRLRPLPRPRHLLRPHLRLRRLRGKWRRPFWRRRLRTRRQHRILVRHPPCMVRLWSRCGWRVVRMPRRGCSRSGNCGMRRIWMGRGRSWLVSAICMHPVMFRRISDPCCNRFPDACPDYVPVACMTERIGQGARSLDTPCFARHSGRTGEWRVLVNSNVTCT